LFRERHFGSSDFNVAIDLYRVAVNNLAVECKGEFDCERAFAGSGWSNNCDYRRRLCLVAHVPEDSTRKRMTAQSSASTMIAPMI